MVALQRPVEPVAHDDARSARKLLDTEGVPSVGVRPDCGRSANTVAAVGVPIEVVLGGGNLPRQYLWTNV